MAEAADEARGPVDNRPTVPKRVSKDAKGRPLFVVPPSRLRAATPAPRVTKRFIEEQQ